MDDQPQQGAGSSKATIFWAIGAAALASVLTIAVLLPILNKSSDSQPPAQEVASATAAPTAPPPAPTAAPPPASREIPSAAPAQVTPYTPATDPFAPAPAAPTVPPPVPPAYTPLPQPPPAQPPAQSVQAARAPAQPTQQRRRNSLFSAFDDVVSSISGGVNSDSSRTETTQGEQQNSSIFSTLQDAVGSAASQLQGNSDGQGEQDSSSPFSAFQDLADSAASQLQGNSDGQGEQDSNSPFSALQNLADSAASALAPSSSSLPRAPSSEPSTLDSSSVELQRGATLAYLRGRADHIEHCYLTWAVKHQPVAPTSQHKDEYFIQMRQRIDALGSSGVDPRLIEFLNFEEETYRVELDSVGGTLTAGVRSVTGMVGGIISGRDDSSNGSGSGYIDRFFRIQRFRREVLDARGGVADARANLETHLRQNYGPADGEAMVALLNRPENRDRLKNKYPGWARGVYPRETIYSAEDLGALDRVHQIEGVLDEDIIEQYYRFVMAAPGPATFSVLSKMDHPFVFVLYSGTENDPTEQELTEQADGPRRVFTAQLAAGTYYFKITPPFTAQVISQVRRLPYSISLWPGAPAAR